MQNKCFLVSREIVPSRVSSYSPSARLTSFESGDFGNSCGQGTPFFYVAARSHSSSDVQSKANLEFEDSDTTILPVLHSCLESGPFSLLRSLQSESFAFLPLRMLESSLLVKCLWVFNTAGVTEYVHQSRITQATVQQPPNSESKQELNGTLVPCFCITHRIHTLLVSASQDVPSARSRFIRRVRYEVLTHAFTLPSEEQCVPFYTMEEAPPSLRALGYLDGNALEPYGRE